MVLLLLAGVGFGWVFSSTVNNRKVYDARSKDAAEARQNIAPKLEELEEVQKILEELPSDDVDFEATETLGEIKVGVEENLLSGNRILLGPEAISYVTNFSTDTTLLQELLVEHARLTKADREELEELMEDNEVLKKDRFAVLFDYDHLAQKSGGEDYMPKPGRLVTVPEEMEKDDEGQIEVQMLGSDRTVETLVQGILPLGKADILRSGGRNALQNYQERVARIKRQAAKPDEYSEGMMILLDGLAETEEAPLLNF